MTIPFVVTFIALHFIIFRPVFDYLEARTLASVGARAEAEALRTDIEVQSAAVDQKLRAARAEMAQARSVKRSEALEQEAKLLGEARAAAEQQVAQALEQINASSATASGQLRSAAAALSTDIAEQVLGRAVH